ncbi:MAG: hydroxyethylthiazole kinase [bacterium]
MHPAATALWRDVQRIRSKAPLVHNITNYVVMNFTANALLAAGASPVMAHAVDEVEDMVGIASALVINIGTLSQPWVESMHVALRAAKRRGIPIVLDPVGSGATRYRTETVQSLLLAASPTVIRGNASEIRSLVHAERATRGVDSAHDTEDALDAARTLARQHGCVVSVSGAVDMIVSADEVIRVSNGAPIMPKITGMGCAASALTGAFTAVNDSPLQAAAHAMALNGIAGEMAAEQSRGPGTFHGAFIDSLYLIDEGDIERRLRVNEA